MATNDPVVLKGSQGDTVTYSSPKDFVGRQFKTLEEAEAFFAKGGTPQEAYNIKPGGNPTTPIASGMDSTGGATGGTVTPSSSTVTRSAGQSTTQPAQQSTQGNLTPEQIAKNMGISVEQAKAFQGAFAGGVTPNPEQTGAQAQQMAQSGQLTLPANGSVVDLLNSAGQDSSFAARQQLAQQFGIQNYSGTASQNTELANKYIAAHNQLKGGGVPQTAAEARNALQNIDDLTTRQEDPIAGFYDSYASLDPVTKQVFDVMQQTLSSINTRTSLTEEIMKLPEWQERADIKAELLDLNRIMDGTEDDIREEITAVGGFATESQVQAMAGARNKVLLKQANALTDQFNVLNDYISAVTDLTKADREQVERDLATKLGIAQTMYTMQQNMQNAERENYQRLISQVGYEGVAAMTAGNPAQARRIESLLGLGTGGLQALASYKPPMSEMELLQLENQKLQNQKLMQDLAKVPAGSITPEQQYLGMALQQQTISDTDALLTAPGLNSAVGPNLLARIPVADYFGAKSNFIASVEQLRGQMTLDKLIQAKGSGATFGALSDTELQMIAGAASKLGTWAIKDTAGNVVGYNTSEAAFKKELDTINYFQKLDYVLKGGNPTSVGAVQMADGTYWIKQSDGSYRKL